MTWVLLFLAAFGLIVVFLVVQTRRAGPLQVDQTSIATGQILHETRRDDSGQPWSKLGSRTSANGLDLKFDHDDDPQAEATMFLPGVDGDRLGSTLARPLTVRLTDRFETHHAHTAGSVFQVTLRGTGSVIGRETRILMVVDKANEPLGGRIENDDDTDAAVGDWIEIERAAIIRLRPSGS